jgi:hypothetical protein
MRPLKRHRRVPVYTWLKMTVIQETPPAPRPNNLPAFLILVQARYQREAIPVSHRLTKQRRVLLNRMTWN